MLRGPIGLLSYTPPLCGLFIVICLFSSGSVSARREDDSDVAPALRDFPSAPSADERRTEYNERPFSNGDVGLIGRGTASRRRPLTSNDMSLQRELWDKKMTADVNGGDDIADTEAKKWTYLKERVDESYVTRLINYLLNDNSLLGGDGNEVDHRREELEGYDDNKSEVERRRYRLPKTCGRRPFEQQSVTKRVVLGEESRLGWPWLVQLTQIDAKQPYCGGTLLNDEFVLTAAHCFDRHQPNEVIVTLGDWDRSKKEGTEQRFRIDCVYIHEAYIPKGDYKDDVALIRLKTRRKTVRMGAAVQPACLPPKQWAGDRDLFGPGDECYVVGWGFTDPLTYFNSVHPAILHQARLPILSPKACRKAYGDLYTDKMICAGHMTGDRRTDACKGDSGGPLLCRTKKDQWVVWGIVSWGHNYFCNGSPDKPIPTVYTKVEEYLPWIKQRLRLHKC